MQTLVRHSTSAVAHNHGYLPSRTQVHQAEPEAGRNPFRHA